jgi:predicted  nucleic acid-binding Zn-ribbon protein
MTIEPTQENVQRIRQRIAERRKDLADLRVLHDFLSAKADEQWRRILAVESEIRAIESALVEIGIAVED